MIVTDLNQLTVPVTHSSDVDHEEVIDRIREELQDVQGFGLAANQIGVQNSRSCILDVKEEIELINPRIVDRSGTTRTWESCLSIPGERLRTERSVWVTVEADNWMGKLEFGPGQWTEQDENDEDKKQEDPAYLESVVVQHEIDHLNGNTIFDKKIERVPYEKSDLEKLGRNDKIEVENAEGDVFEVKWKYAKKHDDWNVLEIS